MHLQEKGPFQTKILFHEDITGKEITSKLLAQVKKLANVEIYEYTTMTDIIVEDGICREFTQRIGTVRNWRFMQIIRSGQAVESVEISAFYQFPTSDRGCAWIFLKSMESVWSIWIMCRSTRQHCIPQSREDVS